MPISEIRLMEACGARKHECDLYIAVIQSAKGALVCASTAFVGGILLGPVGIPMGAVAGGMWFIT